MIYEVYTMADGMDRVYSCDTSADASVLYHALIRSGDFDRLEIRLDGVIVQTWAKF